MKRRVRVEWKPVLAVGALILWGIGCASPVAPTDGDGDDSGRQQPADCTQTIAALPAPGYYQQFVSVTVTVDDPASGLGQAVLAMNQLSPEQNGETLDESDQLYEVGEDGDVLMYYVLNEEDGEKQYVEYAELEDLAFQLVSGCIILWTEDVDLNDIVNGTEPNEPSDQTDSVCGQQEVPLYADDGSHICLKGTTKDFCIDCRETASDGWSMKVDQTVEYEALGSITVSNPADPNGAPIPVTEGERATVQILSTVEFVSTVHPADLGYEKVDLPAD